MNEIKNQLSRYGKVIEKYLKDYYSATPCIPERLLASMLYTLNAGGKRIRPALCLAFCELIADDFKYAIPFASALEMIHTYSLIHDDLPAMDNDDTRRGKPTCHIAFDETTAILAGDALLTDAFSVALKTNVELSILCEALDELARAAGSQGMAGGQMLDMQFSGGKKITRKNLEKMELMKTGALLKASCLCGALLGNGTREQIEAAGIYGLSLGQAFQIIDDILDITGSSIEMGKNTGNDSQLGKTTWPDLLGVQESFNLAKRIIEEGLEALTIFPAQKTEFLTGLAQYVLQRRA